MATVFVSHASRDDALAEDIVAWLHANGFRETFVDHLDILGGESFADQIRERAAKCRVVLCVITPNWLASSDCFNEYQAAWYMGKAILPLLFVDPSKHEPGEPGRRLARVVAETQGIDLRKALLPEGRLALAENPATAGLLMRSLEATGARAGAGRRKRLGVLALAGLGGLAAAVGLAAMLTRPDWATRVDAEAALPGGLGHSERFRDCETCPEMVALAGGQLLMGAPAERIAAGDHSADQGPQRLVSVAPFALGRHEVTRAQFSAFLEASGHARPSGCITWEDGVESDRADRSIDDPGYSQGPDHPAVCLTWHDAQAYVDWLARETGKPYRLPSEAEWEYAARAGSDARFSFGADVEAICRYDNIADADARARWPSWETVACSDGVIFTAPVGSFEANGFGIADLYGNAREWVRDCWHTTYDNAPATSEAWVDAGCDRRVARGGSWDSKPSLVASSWRLSMPSGTRHFLYGFRVARDLD
ncbi:MAG: SUMF1/EgtB/PvdO family nonheme iron enzyme [Roseovarius sp.]